METIDAVTLDLDDTLWAVWPVIHRAEDRLWAHIKSHHPRVSDRYDGESLRVVRDEVAAERPDLVHDLTELRIQTLMRAFMRSDADVDAVPSVMAIFLKARNDVVFFDDAISGLEVIAARFPILAVSNGNADIRQIGIDHLFQGAVSAIDAGVAKPHPDIFLQACRTLGSSPARTLHVGDHQEQDIAGARSAGLKTAWINRDNAQWNGAFDPDIVASDMLDLARKLRLRS